MHVDCVYFCFFGCQRIRLSVPKSNAVPVYRPRPPASCARSLPTKHRVMGHQAISLVSISKMSRCTPRNDRFLSPQYIIEQTVTRIDKTIC